MFGGQIIWYKKRLFPSFIVRMQAMIGGQNIWS